MEIFICLLKHVNLASNRKMELLSRFISCSLVIQPNSSQILSALVKVREEGFFDILYDMSLHFHLLIRKVI